MRKQGLSNDRSLPQIRKINLIRNIFENFENYHRHHHLVQQSVDPILRLSHLYRLLAIYSILE